MTSWEDMTELEQMQCQYWDMYKDAYNYRPRNIDTSEWDTTRFALEFESLAKIINANEAERIRSEELAVARFEAQIEHMRLTYPSEPDRTRSIEWIHEAEKTNGDNDYLCHLLGLPYGYLEKPGE